MTRTLSMVAVVTALGLASPVLAAEGAAPPAAPAKAETAKKPAAAKVKARTVKKTKASKKVAGRKGVKSHKEQSMPVK